jgi:nucleotide-binding universal stress UspA family protein
MQRILVALDGSAESEQILDEVVRIAGRDVGIDLVHVVPALDRPIPGVGLDVDDLAAVYLENVAERLEGHNVRTFVLRGAPEEEIPKAALTLGADLLAMTTHGRRGLSHLLMGSVAEIVVRNSPVPVLMTRPGLPAPRRPVERILVPFDGTAASGEVFDTVRTLAAGREVEVLLLQVVTPLVADSTTLAFLPTPKDPALTLEEQVLRLRKQGLRVTPVVAHGDPATQILEHAGKLQVDLIAMSTSGRKGLSRLLLGSVAEQVVRKMDRPVVLHRVAPSSETLPRIQKHHAPGSE